MTRYQGFTLLEVIVAVAITASISVGSVQLLHTIIVARDSTEVRSDQMIALQRLNAIVSRDIEQFINRPILDAYGDEQDALLLDDGDYLLELTRTGWRNRPGVEDPRSELQRIAYQLESIDSDACEAARRRLSDWGIEEPEGECLVRYVWSVLDRSYDSEPRSMVVLDQIEELDISLLADTVNSDDEVTDSTWYDSWPIVQGSDESVIPQGMRWKMTLPIIGEATRLWTLAHDGEEL
ncbi:type II secretion system minor pseudopilin GspJ [Oceanobacter sp. 4_MG-2023]|uniref:type II secretion system minor pseudopilin GspJ n=1 Tax=Oceanobacter sp. 4_MG-2023 TaxID=3062623 RepID=UPI0027367122|nr:type II secretion system minor pseudopilin GspJ [Oceanobacter sp. 4_MG-2023]MDP2546714.1 type II secretion system minor pseudopilin GspJ [Oceanobacter sp. 4_MG-2023]